MRKWCWLLLLLACPVHAEEPGIATVAILADAPLSLPLARIAQEYTRREGVVVAVAFATPQDESGQTVESVAADVLITAKSTWLEALKEQGLVDLHSEMRVASDHLALVGPAASTVTTNFSQGFPSAELITAMGEEPVFALPNPQTLPEGIAAREALRHFHADADLEPYTLYPKERAQLKEMISKQAYGIMLASEARQQEFHVVGILPLTVYTPVTYRAVVLAGENMDEARRFVEYLRSREVTTAFTTYGFSP